jgi:EAL domain-containing protein (putative c-di-GMP-specific phosphodiesterase class I)
MIEMHYQPIQGLPGRQVDYYEALARIRYNGELILPDAFLPVIGNRRLEAEFDLAVLQQIDADLSSGRFPPGCGISLNLSAQSISRPEIVSNLLELSRHNVRHSLMLEITETSLITQLTEVRTYLDLLRTVNYRIAMDDFGTGYSPLRYLVDLPVDVVKFDISLVSRLGEDNRAGQVVADFARMMGDAGYSLVAEGVETDAVLRKVESLGFAHAQGYLLGRPIRWRTGSRPSAAGQRCRTRRLIAGAQCLPERQMDKMIHRLLKNAIRNPSRPNKGRPNSLGPPSTVMMMLEPTTSEASGCPWSAGCWRCPAGGRNGPAASGRDRSSPVPAARPAPDAAGRAAGRPPLPASRARSCARAPASACGV